VRFHPPNRPGDYALAAKLSPNKNGIHNVKFHLTVQKAPA
jgi:hypothetical protein